VRGNAHTSSIQHWELKSVGQLRILALKKSFQEVTLDLYLWQTYLGRASVGSAFEYIQRIAEVLPNKEAFNGDEKVDLEFERTMATCGIVEVWNPVHLDRQTSIFAQRESGPLKYSFI